MGREYSCAWTYASRLPVGDSQCKMCGRILKGQDASRVKRHLHFFHKDEYKIVQEKDEATVKQNRIDNNEDMETEDGTPICKKTNPWGEETYSDLIARALSSAPEGRLRPFEIYQWFSENVPYFRDKDDSNSNHRWKVCY